MKKIMSNIWQWIYKKFVRPVKKHFRRKRLERDEKYTRIAVGRLVDKFEPLLIRIHQEALRDYDNSMKQSFATKEAQRDIAKFFELKIKEFTNSIK